VKLPAEFLEALEQVILQREEIQMSDKRFCQAMVIRSIRLLPIAFSRIRFYIFRVIQSQSNHFNKRQGEGVTSIEALRTPGRIDQSTQLCCSVLSGFLLPVCRRAQKVGEFVPAFTFVSVYRSANSMKR